MLWKWRPGSLWATGAEDAKAFVLQMLHEAQSMQRILDFLQLMRTQYEQVLLSTYT